MKYSRLIWKDLIDEWLEVYESGEKGPVYCSRTSERKTKFIFSNVKPRISLEDEKLIEMVRMHTTFYFSDGKLCKNITGSNHNEKSIIWNKKLLEEWKEIHRDNSHVHCVIMYLMIGEIRLLLLGRTREETLKKCEELKGCKRCV